MKVGEVREKVELYILSLWFLFLLIVVVTVDVPVCYGADCRFIGVWNLLGRNIVPAISIVLLVFGLVFYLRFGDRVSGGKGLPVKILKLEDVNYEHLTFLTTYIIPLICFNLVSVRYLIALALLLVIIGIIYVKTDKFYANPTLAVLGFRVYRVDLDTRLGRKDGVVIISKERLQDGDQIKYLALDEKVYFVRKS
ncbi:anti-phage protein KwaA [Pseudomonas aeruginosa]|uniref:anti-phage protein KwaA n=1 Tax=Pseudomonas aeruginosa TaxID=287 RepID=UPI0009F5B3BC|nr:anti-phage protein KwaA [Pseudomonas aeruginosa]